MTAEERLAQAFVEAQPASAAKVLEQLPTPQAAAVLQTVKTKAAATLLGHMSTLQAGTLLTQLDAERTPEIVSAMPTQRLAAALRALDAAAREPLLAAMPDSLREPLLRIIPFPEGTAGAAMDPSIFSLPDDVIVADARVRLRTAGRALLYYLYVVDREQHLVGVMDIPELMLAPPRARLRAVMHHDVQQLSAWTPVTSIREHPAWALLHAMPVVDEESRLLGAIRYQTMRRLEHTSGEQAPDAAAVTARALGELFQVGTTGLVTGVAATASKVDDER